MARHQLSPPDLLTHISIGVACRRFRSARNSQPLQAGASCTPRQPYGSTPGRRQQGARFDGASDKSRRCDGGRPSKISVPGDSKRARPPGERYARLVALDGVAPGRREAGLGNADALERELGIGFVAVDAIQRRPSRFGHAPVCPLPKNGSSTISPGSVVASNMRCSSASGFCVGCALTPCRRAAAHRRCRSGSASRCASADRRSGPSCVIIELVACLRAFRRPDHRLVGVGEARPEVRHRVGFQPDHVVQQPESQVLQRHAHAEDIVDSCRSPDRAIVFQDAPGRPSRRG